MSFSLSFSPEFFLGDAHPDDMESSDQPISVMQAIHSLSDAQRVELARKVFRCSVSAMTDSMLLNSIRETDTCTDLSPPVEVWIDRQGFFTLLVYD